MFFAFDGMDGVGKSTQADLFCDWLRELGQSVVACRDPGSTQLGERVRQILLDRDTGLAMHARTEMLLYMAARAQLVEEVIRPALVAGQTVVSDRFVLANIVYQGHAGGIDLDEVRSVGDIAVADLRPDCIFLLDLSVDAATGRIDRELDRMEMRGDEFRERLRRGYLDEAARDPERIHVLDAAGSIDEVQQQIRQIARDYLENESAR